MVSASSFFQSNNTTRFFSLFIAEIQYSTPRSIANCTRRHRAGHWTLDVGHRTSYIGCWIDGYRRLSNISLPNNVHCPLSNIQCPMVHPGVCRYSCNTFGGARLEIALHSNLLRIEISNGREPISSKVSPFSQYRPSLLRSASHRLPRQRNPIKTRIPLIPPITLSPNHNPRNLHINKNRQTRQSTSPLHNQTS